MPKSLFFRGIAAAAALPSGGALLLMVWFGVPLDLSFWLLVLPGLILLIILYALSDRQLSGSLGCLIELGVIGGLLGTFAYDIARIPFYLSGIRIYAPINAYGIWLADAERSSRITDVLGWSYHFYNGITFGILYALFMRGRHWGFAVVWGLLLETVVLASPFTAIFGLEGKWDVMAIAYLGHVAYGIPLGIVVQRADGLWPWLLAHTRLKLGAGLICLLLLIAPLYSNSQSSRDERGGSGQFRTEGHRLNPDWLRIERGGQIWLHNVETVRRRVRFRDGAESYEIAPGGSVQIVLEDPGVFQFFVEWEGRSRSSFVIVEPVAETQPKETHD